MMEIPNGTARAHTIRRLPVQTSDEHLPIEATILVTHQTIEHTDIVWLKS